MPSGAVFALTEAAMCRRTDVSEQVLNPKRGLKIIGERSEPHTYRTVGKNLRHIYIYVFYIYIYIYIYTFVRRARAVHARATRKRRTGRLRFNGQYNRLKNGYFSSKL